MPSPLPSRLSSPRPVRQAVLEAFEPRILYAADAAALGWAARGGLAGGVGVQAVQQSWALSQELQAGGGAEAAASSVRELVVIDLSLPDAQVLLAGL
ncbi:MAG: LEPR-XLL domain-containing protein [Rubrivivax sp.]